MVLNWFREERNRTKWLVVRDCATAEETPSPGPEMATIMEATTAKEKFLFTKKKKKLNKNSKKVSTSEGGKAKTNII